MKPPVRVTVTGAAGNISYSLLFRIAAGDMLGPDQPVILQCLEIPPAMDALKGVVMELNDCAFPLVQDIIATDDANVGFKDSDFALLVGRDAAKERHASQRSANRQLKNLFRSRKSHQRQRQTRLSRPRGRQPGQHQRVDHHGQRPEHQTR